MLRISSSSEHQTARSTAKHCRTLVKKPFLRFRTIHALQTPAAAGSQLPSDEPLPAMLPPPLSAPGLIFPQGKQWSSEKAEAKESLKKIGQDKNAEPWVLNFIEFIHWLSFPVGFWVAGYIVTNSGKVMSHLDGNPWRLYLLVLGLLTQVFGGGITGNMMHCYEGWQVAPFSNPLALYDAVKECKDASCLKKQAVKVYPINYNNEWLRSIAYQLLFFFQSLGICFFSMAVYGVNLATLALCTATVFVGLVGPRYPRMNTTINGQPVSPLPVSLFIVFLVNFFVSIPATIQLFGPGIVHAWPPSVPLWGAVAGGTAFAFILGSFLWAPWGAAAGLALYALAHYVPLPNWLLMTLSLLAPFGVGAGGIIEGLVAESTFNQWWHWRAFVILLTGFGLYGLLYWHMLPV